MRYPVILVSIGSVCCCNSPGIAAEALYAIQQGDAAVAIARGQLTGVTDIVELPVDHWTATDHLDTPIGQQLIREVLQRVQ